MDVGGINRIIQISMDRWLISRFRRHKRLYRMNVGVAGDRTGTDRIGRGWQVPFGVQVVNGSRQHLQG
ncbi:hypothetical protein CR155_09025 [Pollutimonas nitritireducens]|uniref:Uncharacterized protein n=1 Tax=Pollutimonas nitritireducens TaxID=2045209 RepID=A0A2N4UGW0_9BURK|nr:hypothetical protein CR155_09025 [Pollutimonas nitritireducens]